MCYREVLRLAVEGLLRSRDLGIAESSDLLHSTDLTSFYIALVNLASYHRRASDIRHDYGSYAIGTSSVPRPRSYFPGPATAILFFVQDQNPLQE